LLVSFENFPHPRMKLTPLFNPLQTILTPPTLDPPHKAWPLLPLFGTSKTCPSHFQVPSHTGVFNYLRMVRSWNNLHKVLSGWKIGKLNNYKVFESEQLKLLNFCGLFGVDQHIMYCQMIRLHYKCDTILLYYFLH
jgi:hypothetical protein